MFKDGCSFLLKEANDALNCILEKTVYGTEKLEESVKSILQEMKMLIAVQMLDQSKNLDEETNVYTPKNTGEPSYFDIASTNTSYETPDSIEISCCKECGKAFKSNHTLKRHIRAVHMKTNGIITQSITSNEYPLELSEGVPYIKKELHNSSNETPKSIEISSCNECGKSFMKKSSLFKHIKNVHIAIKNIKCPLCEYVTSEKSNLDKHIEGRHRDYTDHTCHLCGFSVFREINIRKHYQSVHSLIRIKKIKRNTEGRKSLEISYQSLATVKQEDTSNEEHSQNTVTNDTN